MPDELQRETSVQALDGVRVIDLATEHAEMAGRTLAQFGADVLKIEIAGVNDQARRLPPFDGAGNSHFWRFVGQGKRLLPLPRNAPELAAQIHALLADADILIESLDTATRDALALTPPALRERHPQLIAVSVSPFGLTGPRADDPANELTIEASSGFLSVNGDTDRPPLPLGFAQAAFHAGVQAAADALIALEARHRTGQGQHIDVSMQAAMIAGLQTPGFSPAATLRNRNPHEATDERAQPARDAYRALMPMAAACKDGFVTFAFSVYGLGEQSFEKMLKWMRDEAWPLPEVNDVPPSGWRRKLESGALSAATLRALVSRLTTFLRSKRKSELLQFALTEKVLMAPSASIADLLADPQLQHRHAFVLLDGELGPGVPCKLSRTPMHALPLGNVTTPQAAFSQPRPASVQRTIDADASQQVGADGALSALRVLDFSWALAGPVFTRTLADHGAQVVRIESTRRVDVARLMPPLLRLDDGSSYSHGYGTANTSKQSLTLDLSRAEGRALALRLIAWADVVVENFSPGVMQRLGFDYATLRSTRPDLIMVSSSMYGGDGPGSRYAGFGSQGSALAGHHALTGWPDRIPTGPNGAYTDVIAPRFTTAALLAAIQHRHRTGEGQYIELSQVECALQFLGPVVLAHSQVSDTHPTASARGSDSTRFAPHGVYAATEKERYVAIAVASAAEWAALCGCIAGLPQIDPSLSARAHEQARRALHAAIDAAIRAWVGTRHAEAAAQELCAAGVPASLVARPTDLLEDPQLRHRGYFVTLDLPGRGDTIYEAHPSIFSSTPARLRRPPPRIGQDSERLLHELLGLDEAEIASLKAANLLQ